MIYIWTDKKWSILLNSLNNYTHLQLNWLFGAENGRSKLRNFTVL